MYLYFYETNKLYLPQEDYYKSIDIIDNQVVFNDVESISKDNTSLINSGFPLTWIEITSKFQLEDGKDYTFPRARTSTMSLSSEVTEETTETPKKTIKSTKSKVK